MSRFNSVAYDKLFPRETETAPAPETVVDTFTPSSDLEHGDDPDQTEDQDMMPGPDGQKASAVHVQDIDAPGGDDNGDGGNSEPDSE